MQLLVKLGIPRENIFVTDLVGVVYEGRTELMDEDKIQFAQKTDARTLGDIISGADIFLGLSAGGVLKQDMVAKMAAKPLIFALANPTPEISPELVKAVRDDAIMATGRTDYPNQVNNVLCFPYIFRGALDCGATTITDEMEIAAVHAIAELAQAEQSDVVAAAYVGEKLEFGPEYLIPKPFDPRLMIKIAPAVAQAAADSGVALRPIADMDAYRDRLQSFVFASGTVMKPIYAAAKLAKAKRVAYAEGEEERVLRACQIVVDDGLARPTLIGRPAVIAQRIEKFGLRLKEELDYDVVNVEQDDRYRDFWQTYHGMMERKGVTTQLAKIEMRRRLTLIGAMLLHKGEVDGLICGTWGTTANHLEYIDQVIGKREGGSPSTEQDVRIYACMNGLMLPGRQVFLVDTHVNYDPTAEELAEITVMAAEEMLRFGITPKAALLSHSNFGSSNLPSAIKMRDTLALLRAQAPWLEVDGEMHGDIALDTGTRQPDAQHPAARRGQPAGAAQHRRGQHRLQPAENRRRRQHRHRPRAAGRCQAGAHPHGQHHRAPHRQHDGADGGRRQRTVEAPAPLRQAGWRIPPPQGLWQSAGLAFLGQLRHSLGLDFQGLPEAIRGQARWGRYNQDWRGQDDPGSICGDVWRASQQGQRMATPAACSAWRNVRRGFGLGSGSTPCGTRIRSQSVGFRGHQPRRTPSSRSCRAGPD